MKYARRGLLIIIAVVSIFVGVLVTELEIRRGPLSPEDWPVTVEAVVEDLLPKLSLSDKLMIFFTRKEDVIFLHFDLGLLIRNRYGLWRGNEKLMLAACGVPCHLDDASLPIMVAVWNALHSFYRSQSGAAGDGKGHGAPGTKR